MVTHWEHMTGRLSFKVKVLDTQLCQLFETPWTLVHQAPLSMEFFRQEYWSGLPFLSPGDRPNPGTESAVPASLALAGRFFTICVTREALIEV